MVATLPATRAKLGKRLTWKPFPGAQTRFLASPAFETLFGGAAGPGKTACLVMEALRQIQHPRYNGIIFRRTYKQLEAADGLIARSKMWYPAFGGIYNESDHVWTFPSGARIFFSYLERDAHLQNYQGAQYAFCGFDELTQFTLKQYLYMFSRVRVDVDSGLRAYVRSTSNPGGLGHCVPYGDVLTPQGWRDIKDMAVGDAVYTVDPSGELVASHVEQVHRSHYDGELINVEVRGLSVVCTPNHRVAKVGGTHSDSGAKFSLVEIDKLPGQATLLRSVVWRGQPLPGFQPERYPTRQRKLSQPTTISGRQFAALLGWFLSEGFTVDRDKLFGISQTKPEQRKIIRALLADCGFTFSEADTAYTVYAPDWWNYFQQFGGSREKFIPQWVKQGDQDDLEALFTAMMDGDGHWCTRNRSGTYYSISKQLADDVAEIALKLGYVVYTSHRQRDNRSSLSYQVNFKRAKSGGTELLTGNHIYNVKTTTKRRSDMARQNYQGEVYCIGVPDTHNFIIRQNGSIWVSGNSWVKSRFVDSGCRDSVRCYARIDEVDTMVDRNHEDGKSRSFIPATYRDNPKISKEYIASLKQLSRTERLQLMNGDWDVVDAAGMFKREWFKVIDAIPTGIQMVRRWDLAASEPSSTYPDPDWTVGALVGRDQAGNVYIADIQRLRATAGTVEERIKSVAATDGISIPIRIEQEAGASGKSLIDHYRRMVLAGYQFEGVPSTGSKEVRAKTLAGQAEVGNVRMLRAAWNQVMVEEFALFPAGNHDDQVDAVVSGFLDLTSGLAQSTAIGITAGLYGT